jgi:hypothetical protein
MKRLLLAVMMVLLFAGWSTAAVAGWSTPATESEFFDHDSHYKSWDHIKFSLWGYKHMDQKDIEKSRTEGWWGKVVEVPQK